MTTPAGAARWRDQTRTDNTKDEWITPPYIPAALGRFDLDPCTPDVQLHSYATNRFCERHDGLAQPWEGRVWMNPPYGKQMPLWLKKLAKHGNGIALVFARTETLAFKEWVYPCADGLFMLEGRLRFLNVDGTLADSTAGSPSCLIAYGLNNLRALRNCGLKGRLLRVDKGPD